MKKAYEQPTAQKVSFQLTENIADIDGTSIDQGVVVWSMDSKGEYQFPVEP